MATEFDRILDECIDRINSGEGMESCLADYPQYADELRLFLDTMMQTKSAYSFTPSNSAMAEARQRFNAVLSERQQRRETRQPISERFMGWSKVWATAATVILIAVAGYFGLKPVLFPSEAITEPGTDNIPGSDTQVTPQPGTEGNFVFLISDDVNAIDDFTSLNITIAKIGLQLGGESGKWIEIDPEVEVVDLTLVPGEKAQKIWRGDIPEGQYTKVFIHVSDVSGILKGTDVLVSLELPSEKLQISRPFEVASDSVVSFVYDITVVQAGQSGRYILQPQVGQSGTDQIYEEVD